ncbi:TonB-dependent receptor [Thalassotalea profundi]|uniref:TonB-dependent receptor n=1 Tax=Thalassotalea profundi TaxID=2036687 RepID=A0ABQ3IMU7_9GAMM|nr:TonB-dependent receptor [Thalassotalea profundi]GHE86616.1 hypothetical protein GCM10011501_14760 [Thalassotalea profundi]
MLKDFQSGKALTSLKKHPVAIALLSTMAVSPLTVYAEETNQANDEDKVEVVTVTAQKRIQNILKVPLTVGTVSESLIEESGSILLSDVDKFIPGFDFSDSSMTQAGITMRGISSPNISVGGDPSSATFYDDIYMPRAAQSVVFSDMARIEVLKGPQGTLFGRNAAMGVVNMVPKSPFADFEGFVKGSFGTDNLQRLEGMVNIPLSDNVYMRANFLSNKQDGFIENVAVTNWNDSDYKQWDLGERDHSAARVALLWDISDATNFQLSYDFDDLEQGPPMAVGISEYAYNNGQSAFSSKAENDVRNGVEARDMYGVTAKLHHEFNNEWSMKYVLGYRDWETENRQDEDGTADITRYFDTSNNEDSNILYTELQLNYIGDKVNAVAGFSYSKEKVKQTTELNVTTDTAARLITGDLNNQIDGLVAAQVAEMLGGNTDAHAAGAFGPGVTFEGAVETLKSVMGINDMDHMWDPDDWAGALNGLGLADQIMAAIGMPGVPLTADIVSATGDLTYDIVSAQLPGLVGSSAPYIPEIFGPSYAGQFWQESINNTGDFTNWGVFADLDYAIDDKWNVIVGLRYSKDDKDFTWDIPVNTFSTVPSNSLMPAGVQVPIGNILFPQVNLAASDSWSKVTGRFVTSYQIDDDQMIFASYSTGYKSGGFDSLTASTKSFAPEDTTNYELGYKAVLWDEVIANISAYYLELDNLQRSIDSKAPGSSQAIPTIINEDREITGVEFDLRWHINKSVTAGVVTEIRSTEYISPDFYNGDGDLIAATQTSSNAKANYTFTLDWMPDFSVGTTNFHLDYVFVKNVNADRVGLEDYVKSIDAYFEDTELLNARLSWTNSSDKLEVGLWGKNLLDNRYVSSIGGLTASILGTPHGRINRGLEMGLDVKYNF